MSAKSAEMRSINPNEPPYCFKSTDDLKKHQARYNQYNIFHMVHRLSLIKERGLEEPLEIDKSSIAYKLYKDFKVPPTCPAYQHLNLHQHWIAHMANKGSRRRPHNPHKGPSVLNMSFQELAQEIAEAYKKIDPETKTWLSDVSSKLYAYNRAQRDQLWRFIKGRREEAKRAAEKKMAREEEARAAAKKAKIESVKKEAKSKNIADTARVEEAIAAAGGENQRYYVSPPIFREQLAMPFGPTDHDMMQHLQSLHMQALALSARPTYSSSPFMYSHNALGGLTPAVQQYQPLQMQNQESPKRQHGDDSKKPSRIEPKRARLETGHAADAYSHESSSYLGRVRNNTPSSSAFVPNLPFAPRPRAYAGIPSIGTAGSVLGARVFDDDAIRRDQILLGYRLGLMDAARAGASPGMICREPNQEGDGMKKNGN